jgi:hypothetical protein
MKSAAMFWNLVAPRRGLNHTAESRAAYCERSDP